MRILVNLGEGPSRWLKNARDLGACIRPVLESLVVVNQVFLQTHQCPLLYHAGVRYQLEPEGTTEEFACVPVVLRRGWGDCDDLAPWRVAELRNQGEKAKIRIQWKPQDPERPKAGKLYHVLVRRGDGSIEDPSRILGMS